MVQERSYTVVSELKWSLGFLDVKGRKVAKLPQRLLNSSQKILRCERDDNISKISP